MVQIQNVYTQGLTLLLDSVLGFGLLMLFALMDYECNWMRPVAYSILQYSTNNVFTQDGVVRISEFFGLLDRISLSWKIEALGTREKTEHPFDADY